MLCMVEVAQHRGGGDEGCGRSHRRIDGVVRTALGCPKWQDWATPMPRQSKQIDRAQIVEPE